MNNVIMDLDDYSIDPERNCMPQLMEIRRKFPKMKVTLFTIPFYKEKDYTKQLNVIKDHFGDFIELAIHGWTHDSNFECSKWDYKTAKKYIKKALDMGCFVKGFKAPGWQISRDTYRACKDLGLWVADHKISIYTEDVPNKERRPEGLKVYEIDHPWMVHGHTWECEGNGIKTLIKKGLPFTNETKFHFISEIINERGK